MSAESVLAAALNVLAALALAAALFYLLRGYFSGCGKREKPQKEAASFGRRLLLVGLWFLATRLCLYLLLLGTCALRGEGARFLYNPFGYLCRWDANHYLRLAENWYVNEGDARFHLVFFPLYPLLLRLFNPLFLGRTAVTATLLSNLCLFGAGLALYRLAEADYGPRGAARAVKYLMLSPLSVFFSIPYSESLFLLLTVLSALCARKKRFGPAILFGALASATRLLGALAAVFIFFEMNPDFKNPRRVLKNFLLCCLVLAGFAAYLYLNYSVSGDPLRFLVYQREHWSQNFGSLFSTLRYTVLNALNYDDRGLIVGTWLPQALSILLSPLLLCLCLKRLRAGWGAYSLLYIYLSVSPTWLLSGSRYLAALFTMPLFLSILSERRGRDIALTALSALAACYCLYLYAIEGTMF